MRSKLNVILNPYSYAFFKFKKFAVICVNFMITNKCHVLKDLTLNDAHLEYTFD